MPSYLSVSCGGSWRARAEVDRVAISRNVNSCFDISMLIVLVRFVMLSPSRELGEPLHKAFSAFDG
ncbi:hypothetical protein D3C71_1717210 [compost metagenome]